MGTGFDSREYIGSGFGISVVRGSNLQWLGEKGAKGLLLPACWR